MIDDFDIFFDSVPWHIRKQKQLQSIKNTIKSLEIQLASTQLAVTDPELSMEIRLNCWIRQRYLLDRLEQERKYLESQRRSVN